MSKIKKQEIDTLLLRPTVFEVDLDALRFNFQLIRDFVNPAQVMAIVKANAYGHGAVTCAKLLVEWGAKFLGVALVEEGIELREAGIDVPILVMGGVSGAQIKLFLDYDLDITASSVAKLQVIDATAKEYGKRARVHLKVDTGMERIGVHWYSASTLFEETLKVKHCDVIGVYSHFAAAVGRPDFAKLQLERFLECLRFFEQHSLPAPIRHFAASGAMLTMKESCLDMVRAGISLYGVYPDSSIRDALELKPVMSLHSKVVYFKVVRAGSSIGYECTYTPDKDTRVVTVPIGYGDGYKRGLSNKGSVLIRGRKYPIAGLVCMDQIMVDIGQGEAYNGDDVVLIGKQGDSSITIEEIAELAQTSTYDVLVSTNMRVPRRFHLGDRVFMERYRAY